MTGRGGDPEPTAASVAVHVQGLRKRFGYRDVLRGVNVTVPRGICWALFGPNGAGKSTLLRVLATQWTYHEGAVHVAGHDVLKSPIEVRRRIGVVFHDSFLRSEFTLDENIRFTCDLYGVRYSEVRERIEDLLELFSLAHRRHDRVSTFSQGMTRRAGLIRSLLHDPEIWILDEPFSGLDPAGREILERLILDFPGAGRTVLLVTHQTELGLRLAPHRAWMVDGELRDGPPETAAAQGGGGP